MSLCQNCGAEIIFVIDQDGTKMPINKTRVRIYSDQTGFYETIGKGKPLLMHISHFVTCPKYSKAAKRMYGGQP